MSMNKDTFQNRWNQVKANFKKQFANFSDAEISKLKGSYEEVSKAIQQKYGYSHERVAQELDNFISQQMQHDASRGDSSYQYTKEYSSKDYNKEYAARNPRREDEKHARHSDAKNPRTQRDSNNRDH